MKQFFIIVGCSFFILSCNESFPLRNDPVLPLTGTVDVTNMSLFAPNGPLYQPDIVFLATVKNMYDETLQGLGDFKGVVEVVWERDTTFRKTFYLNKSSLTENRRYKYDASTNVLTMDPNDQIQFIYRWDYRTDDGRRLDSAFVLVLDEVCYAVTYISGMGRKGTKIRYWRPRQYTYERFIISGYIKAFKDLAAIQIPPHGITILYETFKKDACRSFPGGGG
ncbi:MAG: hypothetical protein WCW40_01985 [Bacteroidota bacterium]